MRSDVAASTRWTPSLALGLAARLGRADAAGEAGCGSSLIARVEAQSEAKVNEEIEIAFNMEKVHLFDPDSLERIV